MSNETKHTTADYEINREQAEQKEQEQERLRKLRYQATDTKKDWVDKFANGETRKYKFVGLQGQALQRRR